MADDKSLLGLLKQLYDLTQEQSKWIGRKDYHELTRLGDQKQQLIESIGKLELVSSDGAEQIRDLLLQIQSIERANEKDILAEYIGVCAQLTEINKTSEPQELQARFLDKRA